MQLKILLEGFSSCLATVSDMPISGLTLDSRQVLPGNVFIALAGTKQHGLTHAEQALANGACAVVFDPAGNGAQLAEQINLTRPIKVPMIAVDNLSNIIGNIAARFYGHPSRLMNVIGITGTNGKTSCSQFLAQLLDDCGIIGTLGWGEWGKLNKTLNTTPDALTIQKILAELLKSKKQAVAMEVSSHGLEQGRVNGVDFKGAVFTNISRDHLDYHGTMEAYLEAKLALLSKPGLDFVVVNMDDAYSDRIIAATPESVTIWGISVKGKTQGAGESVIAENIQHREDGIEFDIRWTTAGMQDDCRDAGGRATQGAVAEVEQCKERLSTTAGMQDDCRDAGGTTPRMEEVESRLEQRSRAPKVGALSDAGAVAEVEQCKERLLRGTAQRVVVPLYGDFNGENVLCVLAVLLAMGASLADAANKLTLIKPVSGRMERFGGETEPLVFVDYAHTPDAMEKVLSSLNLHCKGALWVVFGCGGNRDAGKRPQMGSIAEHWADHVIITDDNPRFENSRNIINDILAGCSSAKVEVIENREQAIQNVIARAARNDCIVIAGKGHEDYQEINGVQQPFSDRRVVIDALKMRAKKYDHIVK